jgi:hypothetical protein
MEKGGCFPGEMGAFLDLLLGKVGKGGQEAVLRAVSGCFLDLGRSAVGRAVFVGGPWTMARTQDLCGLSGRVRHVVKDLLTDLGCLCKEIEPGCGIEGFWGVFWWNLDLGRFSRIQQLRGLQRCPIQPRVMLVGLFFFIYIIIFLYSLSLSKKRRER